MPAPEVQPLAMDRAALTAFLAREFPQAAPQVELVDLAPMTARMRLLPGAHHLRPGGTISGPSMVLLADVAFYAAVLGMIGPEPLTVTTNLNITFLRKPAPGDLLCECRILKLGRTLVSGDATLFSDAAPDKPVAHATLTYARPQ